MFFYIRCFYYVVKFLLTFFYDLLLFIMKNFLQKIFNIATDPGVVLSVGNSILFWEGGGVPQIASVGAVIATTAIKTVSEFLPHSKHILTHDNAPLFTTGVALSFISGDAIMNDALVPALAAGAFAVTNFSLAGVFNSVRQRFSNVATYVTTQAETWSTIGLGAVAYMSAGDSSVSLPLLNQDISTSMITFIPTAIGGAISLRNVLGGKRDEYKPLLWMAGGIGLTAGVALSGGAVEPAIANALFAGAYVKLQQMRDADSKNMVMPTHDV